MMCWGGAATFRHIPSPHTNLPGALPHVWSGPAALKHFYPVRDDAPAQKSYTSRHRWSGSGAITPPPRQAALNGYPSQIRSGLSHKTRHTPIMRGVAGIIHPLNAWSCGRSVCIVTPPADRAPSCNARVTSVTCSASAASIRTVA